MDTMYLKKGKDNMDYKKINLKKFKAYENIINIELFNEMVSFTIKTTNINSVSFINKLKNESIWFIQTNGNLIQEKYGFRYLGEILERYEQRIGTDIKDVRAIALALAYSREIITNEMIIGTQLIDFINKIKRLSKKDMYLKAALYLYDKNKYYTLFEEVVKQKFTKTEDIVFAFSLFYDIKLGFDLLEKQLKEFLGKAKTISVIKNYGIYNWLIRALYPILKNNRKKGLDLFKAIITIPTCLIKQDSKIFKTFIDNDYTKEDISFLNYICIFYATIPKTVRISRSIVEEKIAIEFCINILNSNVKYSNDIYESILIMLSDYYNFDIKCYGYSGLKQAIINYLDIKVPEIFIKFYDTFNERLFSFDIMDDKWDIVQQIFTPKIYRNLFDSLLVSNDYSIEDINIRINKYNQLTNTDYLYEFNKYDYGRNDIYSKLVQKDIINLFTQFENYLLNYNEKNNIDIKHLSEYVYGIKDRKSFEFYKYLFDTKHFSSSDLKKWKLGLSNLFINRSYYYSYQSEIDIKREFLSKEETIELFYWLEDYIFSINPNDYIDFTFAILIDKFIITLFSKDSLRKLYFTLSNIDEDIKNNNYLREIYLTKEELELIKQQKIEEKEKQRKEELTKIKNLVQEKFNSIEKDTFKKIYEYIYSYRWEKEETSFACTLVKDYLNNSLNNYNFNTEEIIYFNKLCNLLLKQNYLTTNELKDYISNYIMKGELVLCKEY